VPIEDRPILEFVLDRLREAGFRRVTLCVGHLAELIRAFFGDGRAWGVELDYVVEAVPLSTIGPLAFVPDLGENFLVMNGDVLTDLDPARLMRAHLRSRADLTVATYRRQVNVDYGVIRYGGRDLRVRGFVEKPSIPYDVSMGIYALHRRCLDLIEPGRPLGFDELIQRLLDRRRPVRAFPHDGAWLDVGRPEDYELAQSWRPRRDGASAGGQRGRRAGPRTQGGASRR